MKYPLYSRIALATDLPENNLRRGDVATIVETYEGPPSDEPGYELEFFNAIGEAIAVVTVTESQIEHCTVTKSSPSAPAKLQRRKVEGGLATFKLHTNAVLTCDLPEHQSNLPLRHKMASITVPVN